MVMWVGSLEFDLLLGDVRTLKEKRAVVRPILADVAHTFDVSVAEVGHRDLYRRAVLGVAVAGGDRAHVVRLLDAIERRVAGRPEIELSSTHRVLRTTED
jgi:uncharacterized protein